jgi:hypothetical protein
MLGGNEDQAIEIDGSKTYQIHAGGAIAPAPTNKSIFRDYT